MRLFFIASLFRDGKPSARYVLMKGVTSEGFVFFTNYQSRKGQELDENPFAALTFWWAPLDRQVRVEGRVEKLSETESAEYFHSRPRESQLGALVSRQSAVIPSRQVLEERLEELKRQYTDPNTPIPKPDYWGGYLVRPYAF